MWISESLLAGDEAYIMADLPERRAQQKPPSVNNFVPDVYVSPTSNTQLIIGEAKTGYDLDSRHTREQVKAFLRKCAELNDSVFVFAVPWDMVRLAKSIVRDLQTEVGAQEVDVVVLDKLAG
jgi:hypothetical protein